MYRIPSYSTDFRALTTCTVYIHPLMCLLREEGGEKERWEFRPPLEHHLCSQVDIKDAKTAKIHCGSDHTRKPKSGVQPPALVIQNVQDEIEFWDRFESAISEYLLWPRDFSFLHLWSHKFGGAPFKCLWWMGHCPVELASMDYIQMNTWNDQTKHGSF